MATTATTRRRSTARATVMLAGLHECGADEYSPPDQRLAAEHLEWAFHCGRQWAWTAAGEHLSAAYEALGAEPPPEGGYEWHRGSHPIQKAIQATEDGEDA